VCTVLVFTFVAIGKAPGLGEEEYNVSPDGYTLAFAARRVEADTHKQQSDMAWSTNVPIYTVDLRTHDKKYIPQIVSGSDWFGYNSQPSFSPDGTKLAFLSMRRPQYESDQNLLRILDLQTLTISTVSESLPLSIASVEWSLQGSETLYCTAQVRGSSKILRLNLEYSVNQLGATTELKLAEVMTGDESRSSPLVVPYNGNTEGLYFLETSMSSPNELILTVLSRESELFLPLDSVLASSIPTEPGESTVVRTPGCGRHRVQIYNPSPEFSNGDIIAPTVHSHYILGANNDLVHCWYIPPPGVDLRSAEAGSIPLLLIIHGGPQGAIMNAWHYRWNLGIFAAMGYAVVAVNFHGSTGYGQAFCDSIRGNFDYTRAASRCMYASTNDLVGCKS
jgi:dipeptidyl aminopeptidase/acylaminoacyl peptidase